MFYPEDHIHLRRGDMLILTDSDRATTAAGESSGPSGSIDMAMTVRRQPWRSPRRSSAVLGSASGMPSDDLTVVVLG
jgi:hypothetical protein